MIDGHTSCLPCLGRAFLACSFEPLNPPQVLPEDIRTPLLEAKARVSLLEIVLDLGRKPYARFRDNAETLADRDITREDLENAARALGEFGPDNRAGIEGTLHRISAIRNRNGVIIGLTCRVGRAVRGPVDMVRDLLHGTQRIFQSPSLWTLFARYRAAQSHSVYLLMPASQLRQQCRAKVHLVPGTARNRENNCYS
jgi:hypothetical protein